MQETQSSLEANEILSILKDDFSLRTDPSIFISIAPPVLLNQSNERSWTFLALKLTRPFMSHFTDVIGQIQVQQPHPVVATDQMPDHT